MNSKKAKAIRRLVKKNKIQIERDFLRYCETLPFSLRLTIAWHILLKKEIQKK